MKMWMRKATFLVIALILAMLPAAALAAETVEVSIPVTIHVTGEAPKPAERYTVTLQGMEDPPMPAETTLTITGEGTAQFPAIGYTMPGVYQYTVSQVSGDHARGSYDTTVYTVKVTVTNDEEGGLVASVTLRAGEEDEKLDAVEFHNSYAPVPPTPEETSLTVLKVWSDSGKNRPSSVTVQLLDGSTVKETVTLGSWNSWTYTWKNLDKTHTWKVQEINVPKNYKDSYVYNDNVVTVRNTESLLIQTGQLNWPIPLLTAFGLGLMAVGVVVAGRKRKAA